MTNKKKKQSSNIYWMSAILVCIGFLIFGGGCLILSINQYNQHHYAIENYQEQTFVFEKYEYHSRHVRINNAYYLIYVDGEDKPFRLECNVVRMTGRQLIDELEKGDKITCCFADLKKYEYDLLSVKTEKETIISLEGYKSAQNKIDILWIATSVFIALIGPIVLVVNIVQNKKAEKSDMYKYRINW